MYNNKSRTFTTKKGTVLPLINLKGKDYLMVAHRLVWLNEEVNRFTIDTEYLSVTENESVTKATVSIYDDGGTLIKRVSAIKRENTKGFSDHLEKSETGAIGRALALSGYGTSFALADLDEMEDANGKSVNRLADAPLTPVKIDSKVPTTNAEVAVDTSPTPEAPIASTGVISETNSVTELKPKTRFKKPKIISGEVETSKLQEVANGDDWS